MALAIYALPGYFAGYVQNGYNLGMLLKPDTNHTVQYEVAYNAATEPTILYRNVNWHYTMFGLTPPVSVLPENRQPLPVAIHSPVKRGPAEYFTLSGQRISMPQAQAGAMNRGKDVTSVYIVRQADGSITRQVGLLLQ